MPSVLITMFGGLRPALSPRHLGAQFATVAHMARLTDGTLSCFREPKKVLDTERAATLYRLADEGRSCGELLAFDCPASVVEPTLPYADRFGPVAVFPRNGAAYFHHPDTGEENPIGVPPPLRAPTATIRRRGSLKTEDPRIYVFTYVDLYGIEGPPSAPTEPLSLADDGSVVLAGLTVPPEQFSSIRFLRVYRTTSKPDAEGTTSAPLTFDTQFQLVAEIPAGTTTYEDNARLADIEFGTLDTMEDCPPPVGMCGVVELDTGFYAGFVGKHLLISERHRVWSWPTSQILAFPDEITGIAESHDTLFVATKGAPIRVRITAREDNLAGETQVLMEPDVVRSEQKLPGVGPSAICATPFGAVYVSRTGLVGLGLTGDAVDLTRQRIGAEAWAEYAPSCIAWHDGFLYGASPHKPVGVRYELRLGDDQMTLGDFVTVDMQGTCLHSGRNGTLYFGNDAGVWAWDRGDNPVPYRWRSGIYNMPRRSTFTAAKLTASFGEPVNVTVSKIDDSGSPYLNYTRPVVNSRPFRVRPGTPTTAYMFGLEGTATVSEFHIASSLTELSEAPRA